MAVLQTGQSFASGDQVTATKLQDIANLATFRTGANQTADGSTIEVDSSGGYLKVPSNGIGSNELSSDASVDANRAVDTNHIKDDAVTYDKIQDVAASSVIGNTTGSTATPTDVSILDEDDMASDSDTSLVTQQSVKAYVDGQVASFVSKSDCGGWFNNTSGLVNGSNYTFTHNLGTTDVTVNVYVSSTSTGTSPQSVLNGVQSGTASVYGAVITDITSTQITVQLGFAGYIDVGSGGGATQTSFAGNYIKVVVVG
jgi:hypothetical protein